MQNTVAIETDRLAEQIRLDGLNSPKKRNQWGQFATPPNLALEIAQLARRTVNAHNLPIRFLDPAIGTGSFYSALLQTYRRQEVELAQGIELDPSFAQAARQLWSQTGLNVTQADFTRTAASQPYNLILANPPYVRHHHIPKQDKKRLAQLVKHQLNINVSGLAGLYCYFLLLADAWLADGAISIWLIPSEFMDVNYGNAIKEYLTKNVRLLRIHRFCPNDAQFADALVTSAVVMFERRKPTPADLVCFSYGGHISDPHNNEDIPNQTLQIAKKWTRFPQHQRYSKSPRAQASLGDLFEIRRGIATGANSFFILSRDQALQHKIPDIFLKPILPSPRLLKTDIIEDDGHGHAKVSPSLVLINCNEEQEIIRSNYPDFWNYLQTGVEQGINQRYLTSRRTPWYVQEKRDPAPFICTYMGRKERKGGPFRFIWNKSQAIAANVYLLLYPKARLKEAIDHDPRLQHRIFDALQSITDDMFLDEGRVYGGGLHKLEPKELARVSAGTIECVLNDTTTK